VADGVSDAPRRHDPDRRTFASDNFAGVHPEIFSALAAANDGHVASYGADPYTAAADEVFRAHFGPRAQVYLVFNGTGANVVALQAMTRRFEAVICAASAHINVDECGAPERTAGLKLLPVPSGDGKLTPALVDLQARGWGDQHRVQPKVVSISQSTEFGTVYTVPEIAALARHAHDRGMSVHLDGARIANAAAALDVPLRAFTTDAGVDVVSFGGTKNGLMFGEAVVVLDPDTAAGVEFARKATTQLPSKMRFVAVQFERLLGTDLWLRNARHANAMAARLADAVRDLPGLRITQPVQANAVFAVLSRAAADRLRQRFAFHVWDERAGEVRWMCCYDTTAADVDEFAAAVRAELAVG
jgi:threonine aldolase